MKAQRFTGSTRAHRRRGRVMRVLLGAVLCGLWLTAVIVVVLS